MFNHVVNSKWHISKHYTDNKRGNTRVTTSACIIPHQHVYPEEALPLSRVFKQILDQYHEICLRFLHFCILLQQRKHLNSDLIHAFKKKLQMKLSSRIVFCTPTPDNVETFNLFIRVCIALESGGPSLRSKSKMICSTRAHQSPYRLY